MQDYGYKEVWFFTISVVLAMMLSILPLPQQFQFLRPHWVMLMLVFWLLFAPGLIGLGWYWLIGIVQDLLQATPLGMHALCNVLLVFVFSRISIRVSKLPMWQQVGVVALLSFANALLHFFIERWCGFSVSLGGLSAVVLTNALVWPWLYWLMYGVWKNRLRLY